MDKSYSTMDKSYRVDEWDRFRGVWTKADYRDFPIWGPIKSLEMAQALIGYLQDEEPKGVFRLVECQYQVIEPREP